MLLGRNTCKIGYHDVTELNKGILMEEKNELNDIILNKGGGANDNKKIVLAVATLGVILIVVVMLMNTLTSNGTDNLPQAVLPPEPQANIAPQVQDEPLFEEVEVVQEENTQSSNLDKITQKLKEESQVEDMIDTPMEVPVVQKVVVKETHKKKEVPKVKTTSTGSYYIQVGSFSKYEPNKKFLKSITDKGFNYKYHKVTQNSKTLNKVLVGPFPTDKEARDNLRTIRSSIEAGAFVTKI